MRELRCEEVGDRRVALVEHAEGRYSVTVAVRGPAGRWEDISLRSDRDLELHAASLCYRLRLVEQQARVIEWNRE